MTLSCNGSTGVYSVTVTGMVSSLSRVVTVTFNVVSSASGGCGTGCTATVSSDAIVTNFAGNSTLLSFTATGQTGTSAFANVTIPKSAVPNINALQVRINGTLVTPTITSNSTSLFVYFTFTFHSAFVIQIQLVSTSAAPVLLTFQGFNLDDFDNGVGQLQVFVNGHLVVDIPAGLNHLSGSGDYAPYNLTWVKFGPFDISSFVIKGQNNVTFRDPLTSHFGLVKNVTIVQGSQILLQVRRAAAVFPGHSVTYTFSIPPLVITSFTATPSNLRVDQNVTLTATFTGGTAPFTCFFRFGDDESASVLAVGGSCSVTHDYDDPGSFSVTVTVRGASTSDNVSARLLVTVSEE